MMHGTTHINNKNQFNGYIVEEVTNWILLGGAWFETGRV